MKTLIRAKYFISKPFLSRRLALPALFENIGRSETNGSFRYDDLQINRALEYQKMRRPESETLSFGTTFTDHILQVEWTHFHGWGNPQITPLHYFLMHPGAKVFHYAQAAFEGMKAFKYTDTSKTIALFRPDLNMKRLLLSAERVALPSFDGDELLKCIKKLISIDKDWVPDHFHSSLYIRPTFIGIDNSLGVAPSNRALLYVVTCPVGPYFSFGQAEPVSLLADPRYIRAAPGGTGAFKLASNYSPTLHVLKQAQDQGLDQVLWLYGEDFQIAEAGAMNVFFFLRKADGEHELVTPPLDGTILPGVVRQSVLDLSREWNEFAVSERIITMSEIIELNKESKLLEMFLCGTAVTVCPVKSIRFKGNDIQISTMNAEEPLFQRITTELTKIQYGETKSKWSVPVE